MQQRHTSEAVGVAPAPLAIPPAREIDRRSGLSYTEFVEEYLRPHRPVIITDATPGWKALSTWTLDGFRSEYGALEVDIDGKTYGFAEFVDRLADSTEDTPAVYLKGRAIHKLFPSFLPDVQPAPTYTLPNWLESRLLPETVRAYRVPGIFIGGTGGGFPKLHFDNFHLHAFTTQVLGQKKFTLYSREQTHLVYATGKAGNVSMVRGADVEHPDLEKFPLFADAVPYVHVLEPGESIFIPGGWWHTTHMLNTSITVSINFANASNWSDLARDMHAYTKQTKPVLAGPLAAYLRAFGTARSLGRG